MEQILRVVVRVHNESVPKERQNKVPLENFVVALDLKGSSISMTRALCIMASMISQNYVKGYVSFSHKQLVLAPNPFPPFREVQLGVMELWCWHSGFKSAWLWFLAKVLHPRSLDTTVARRLHISNLLFETDGCLIQFAIMEGDAEISMQVPKVRFSLRRKVAQIHADSASLTMLEYSTQCTSSS